MNLFKSSNPALSEKKFEEQQVIYSDDTMTVNGTVNKVALMGLIVFATAVYSWNILMSHVSVEEGYSNVMPYMIGGAIGGFIAAMIMIFSPKSSRFLAPIYAALEGLFLGGISAILELSYPGIAIQAILGTFGVLFALLISYRAGLIKATERFKRIVFTATAGVAIIYFISIVAGFFGYEIPMIHESGTMGIVFSLVVVVIAALNLIIDFDFIEKNAQRGAPKWMEWYAAFGLILTLVWLYLEILRLLSKLRD